MKTAERLRQIGATIDLLSEKEKVGLLWLLYAGLIETTETGSDRQRNYSLQRWEIQINSMHKQKAENEKILCQL